MYHFYQLLKTLISDVRYGFYVAAKSYNRFGIVNHFQLEILSDKSSGKKTKKSGSEVRYFLQGLILSD